MTARTRKLQEEISQTLKKVTEGIEIFDEIWEKVYSATSQAQKEKFEGDLKKEIKKLQRLRDAIKTWIANNDIKEKNVLIEARKSIEAKMESFKVCERETKTKQYSKEALAQADRLDPEEAAKRGTREWICKAIEELNFQIQALEADMEAQAGVAAKKGRSGRKAGSTQEHTMGRHKWHVKRLELTLRMLDNDNLSHEDIDEVKDLVEEYVQRNAEADFVEDDQIYESLDLDENLLTEDADEEEETEETAGAAAAKEKETEKKEPSPAKKPEPKPVAAAKEKEATKEAPPAAKPEPKPAAAAAAATAAPAAAAANQTRERQRSNPTAGGAPSPGGKAGAGPATGGNNGNNNQLTRTPSTPTSVTSAPSSGKAVNSTLHPSAAPLPPVGERQQTAAAIVRGGSANSSPQPSPALAPQAASLSSVPFGGLLPSSGSGTFAAMESEMGFLEDDDDLNDATFGDDIMDGGPDSIADMAAQTAEMARFFETPDILKAPPSAPPPAAVQPQPQQSLQPVQQTALVPQQQLVVPELVVAPDPQRVAALKMLEHALQSLPDPKDCERPKPYVPPNPYRTPAYYPQTPHPVFNNPEIFSKFDTDTLFFIFYYQQATYQQYLAAKELKKQSWRYHKKYLTWFQRHDQPKVATDEYEQGTYVYFDFETGWCQRIKQEFTFKYSYLEDELTV